MLDPSLVDDVVHVTDLECIVACRALTRQEGILAGGSSGATIAAVRRFAPRIPAGSTVVAIFPDGGDRYLDTIYSDPWVAEHFGADALQLWQRPIIEDVAWC